MKGTIVRQRIAQINGIGSVNESTIAVTGFEVISLDGRDLVTLEINGAHYDMSCDTAKMLASDITKAIKRALPSRT